MRAFNRRAAEVFRAARRRRGSRTMVWKTRPTSPEANAKSIRETVWFARSDMLLCVAGAHTTESIADEDAPG